ncbi:MAG: 3-keto-5-aminohexanoate cleavage protein [Zoogloeaceae bacterium]|nr:3-keto-5-aminohexanoate cleavage protein [Zoogloeaceae bacterium]
MARTVITCALTGAQQGKEANPHLPEQPDEIIQQGLDAWRAGAAVLHLHARDKNGRATGDVAVFKEIVGGLKAAGCDAVINLTTGGAVAGLPLEERLAVIPALRPQLASFSVGSGCLLGRRNKVGDGWAKDKYVPLFQSYAEMEKTARLMQQHGTKPEIEVYHPGMLNNLHELDAMGVFDHPLLVNFVMGIPGEVTPAEISDLQFMIGKLPKHANWHVTGIGARNHFRITTAAVLLGGHLRVGMEDNVYIGPGELAQSNAQLVEKSVRILRELGETPASPAEAKAILGVKEV